MFVNSTTLLLGVESLVIFVDAILLFVSFFAWSDQWENNHMNYTQWDKLAYSHGTTLQWDNGRID
jgi:hypothetical protein